MLKLERYEKVYKENSSLIAEVEITIVEWKYFVILKEFQKGDRRWFNFPTGMKEERDGERKFIPLTGFRDKEVSERFLKAVRVEVDKYLEKHKAAPKDYYDKEREKQWEEESKKQRNEEVPF